MALKRSKVRNSDFLINARRHLNGQQGTTEDNPAFQGLLRDGEEAIYLDILAELPGVTLKDKDEDHQVVLNKDKLDFVILP